MRASLLVLGCLLLAGCRASFGGMMFESTFVSAGEQAESAPSCATISQVVVKDTRADPGLVGQRTRDDMPNSYPLRMVGDVSGWARQGLETVARGAGFAIGAEQAPTLEVTIRTIDLREKVFSNADYTARVVLEASVLLPNGQPCFTNTFEANSKNYGRAGSDENYQQTIGHALEKASAQVFNNTGIRDGLCSRCAPPAPAPPPLPSSAAP